jgi:hypothetical protein
LQIEWLNAGIKSLLIPQTTRELNEEGNPIFSYTGLVRIKRIVVEKEQWSGLPPTIEQKHTERSALHNNSREKLEEVLIVGDRQHKTQQ